MPTTEDTGTDGVICPRKLAVVTVFLMTIFLIASAGTASAAMPIDSCTTINASNAPNDGLVLLNQSIQDASPDSCINITTSNIILDGQNNTVEDDVSGQRGINVTNPSTTLSNVTVRNITVTVWNNGVVYDDVEDGKIADVKTDTSQVIGILLNSSSNINVTDNNPTGDDRAGIFLDSSSNINVTDNNVRDTLVAGIFLNSSSNNNVMDNNVTGTDTDGILLNASSEDNTVMDNDATGNQFGITVLSSSNNGVTNNNATGNQDGILINELTSSSTNNTVTGNNASGNGDGIFILRGDDNNVTGNDFNDNNQNGVVLRPGVRENKIIDNNATGNTLDGINLTASNGNEMRDNNASANDGTGIFLDSSSDNNNVTDNDANSNDLNGIDVALSDGNDVTDNNISGNGINGIILNSGSNNNVTSNNANSNDFNGIRLVLMGGGNRLVDNNVTGNSRNGIFLVSSSDNNITDNNVTENNQGGSTNRAGIRIEDSANVEIKQNRILRNNVFGVRAVNASGLEVRNSLFKDNDGIDFRTSESTVFENVTFNLTRLSGFANQLDINETVETPLDPSNAENIGLYFNATNRTDGSFFNVSVKYTDAAVSDVNESSLELWEYEETWSKVPGSTVDTNTNTVSANITDFSVFAPLAETASVGTPGAGGGECVDRRDISRGQEEQECPRDRTISRGESREDIDRATGRNSDTRRRDRSRGERRNRRGR